MSSAHFSDVTLICDDKKQIKTHKTILSSFSPIFRDILLNDNTSTIFLRGIQHSEMESILQFIYLGEATICGERIDELLLVAKSLDIKELCENVYTNVKTENEDGFNEGNVNEDPLSEEASYAAKEAEIVPRKINKLINSDGKYRCDECDKDYSGSAGLIGHIDSVHKGIKYLCRECGKEFRGPSGLRDHNNRVHKRIKYQCSFCDYKAGKQQDLNRHIQSKHRDNPVAEFEKKMFKLEQLHHSLVGPRAQK